MATHYGNGGIVKVGTHAVAEVGAWDLDVNQELPDDTSMGDDWTTHKAGRKSWKGSITCHWDETDTSGQQALTQGASVTISVYPDGATSGDTYFTGNCTVGNWTLSGSKDGIISRRYNIQGNGALNELTVS